MANLVAPIYPLAPTEERVIEFKGLNRKPFVEDGEMSDMLNLTAESYPLLTQREPRGTYSLNNITEIVDDNPVTREVVEVYSMIRRFEHIAMIAKISDNNRTVFIYNNSVVTSVTGLTADTRMVAINTKICFFPEKKYLEISESGGIVTIGEYGDLSYDKSQTSADDPIKASHTWTFTSNRWLKWGEEYTYNWRAYPRPRAIRTINIHYVYKIPGGETEWESNVVLRPGKSIVKTKSSLFQFSYEISVANTIIITCVGIGDAELATSKQRQLKITSVVFNYYGNGTDDTTSRQVSTAMEAYENNEEARLFMPTSMISGLKADDVIDITGQYLRFPPQDEIEEDPEHIPSPVWTDFTISTVIDDVYATYEGDDDFEQEHFYPSIRLPLQTFLDFETVNTTIAIPLRRVTIKRACPELDHVMEYNNRLWGVSNQDNTIYASKLGDPTNWHYYQTTSIDSWAATQGTDGFFTGCAAYSNHLLFFKEESIVKVYGTAPSNFQTTTTECYGLSSGESKSVQILNDIVFYKSSVGLMAYEGGNPYIVTEKFNCKFSNVVSGTEGSKLYVSFHNLDADIDELLVCDIEKAMWHKEDDTQFRDTCTLGGKLYYIDDSDGMVYITNPDVASETTLNWMATFGPFDEYVENRKIYSKLSLRLITYTGTTVRVWIKINDGNGDQATGGWELVKEFTSATNEGEFIPIIPRRCDKYSIKVEGSGQCEIKTLTKRYRVGTGGKL